METLALTVSRSFATYWTVGAVIAGGVLTYLLLPPVMGWWFRTVQAAKLGIERLTLTLGALALLGGLIAVAAWVAQTGS